MKCPNCQTVLTKSVENGGVLLRGNAPIVRFDDSSRAYVEQRCPTCKRVSRFVPLTIRVAAATPDVGVVTTNPSGK